jgi:hypothetical protein
MNRSKGEGLPPTAWDVEVKEGLQTVKAFRSQLKAMSNEYWLTLLFDFADRPFMNADASALFGTKRQTTWVHLRKMVELGLLEKRGHVYRMSEFSVRFIVAVSNVFESLITGKELVYDEESVRFLSMARDGIESLYARGKVTQDDYVRYRNRVEELISKRVGSKQ